MGVLAVAQGQELDCARRVYAVPGQRFMHKIRTSQPADELRVFQLPEGLLWNTRRQLVEGTVDRAGEYCYYVYQRYGAASRTDTVRLLVSDRLPQPTPFMGLLTWNIFESDISDQRIRLLADAMTDLGLAEAGYRYLCLDDLWAEYDRDAAGHLQWHHEKFPYGLKELSKYVHDKGLKFGIYSDAGTRTCSKGQPGSLGHETVDAADFVSWGFDLLKYDYCNSPGRSADTAAMCYAAMAKALRDVADPSFLYYLCEWGWRDPWRWGAEAGGSCWRSAPDTRDSWTNPHYSGGVMEVLKTFAHIWQYCGINRFNDADMMMCGLHGTGRSSNEGTDGRGMTQDEYTSQFVLWCMWSSPLTLCFDITALYDGTSRCGSGVVNPLYKEDLALITNAALIALDQDPLGQAAETIEYGPEVLVLMKDLADGGFALSVTNLTEAPITATVPLSSLPAMEPKRNYACTDLLDARIPTQYHTNEATLTLPLNAHATRVWRMR